MNASVILLDKVSRAVVGINSEVPSSHPSVGIGLGTDRQGSGTLVSHDGLILTVNYMVIGAQEVVVTMTNGDQFAGQVVARDFTTSLGLIKIDARDLPFLEPVSSLGCELGQEIILVSSLGANRRCADTGVITYLGPFDAAWEFTLERAVCVTASALNVGLGGGPICNSRGQLVAVSYLNFADMIKPILGIPGECFLSGRDELLRHGHRVSTPPRLWLGVLSYTLRDHVVIAGVMPGSPGDKAGLKQGDLVLTADGHEIHERRALYEMVNRHRPGEQVQLRVMRNNRVHEFAIPTVIVDDFLA